MQRMVFVDNRLLQITIRDNSGSENYSSIIYNNNDRLSINSSEAIQDTKRSKYFFYGNLVDVFTLRHVRM